MIALRPQKFVENYQKNMFQKKKVFEWLKLFFAFALFVCMFEHYFKAFCKKHLSSSFPSFLGPQIRWRPTAAVAVAAAGAACAKIKQIFCLPFLWLNNTEKKRGQKSCVNESYPISHQICPFRFGNKETKKCLFENGIGWKRSCRKLGWNILKSVKKQWIFLSKIWKFKKKWKEKWWTICRKLNGQRFFEEVPYAGPRRMGQKERSTKRHNKKRFFESYIWMPRRGRLMSE